MVYLDLPPAHVEAYHKEGFVIVKNFCDSSEVSRLYATTLQDKVLHKNAMEMQDKSGRKSLLSLWFTAGDNVFGYLARSEKIINSVYQLDICEVEYHAACECGEQAGIICLVNILQKRSPVCADTTHCKRQYQ